MNHARWIVPLALLIVLGVPFALRPASATFPDGTPTLVIITPHNEQIRTEYAQAFDRWHLKHHGTRVRIDWRQPGGTSEIRKQLEAVYTRAIQTGQLRPDGTLAPGADPMPNDLFFGGGSYDHSQVKRGIDPKRKQVYAPGGTDPVAMSFSVPAGFDQGTLDEWYGKENRIGSGLLYDPGQYWLGTCLSGFGVCYNRDLLKDRGIAEPRTWWDLTNPALDGLVGLADPRFSGSVETAYDSILNRYGWDDGWKIIRGMCGNARSFANSSTKTPVDVSQGEVAVGVCIDYYGRFQAQAVMAEDETPQTSRVAYVDPIGLFNHARPVLNGLRWDWVDTRATFVDADPISMLRAGPNPELAKRFIEFCLSEEGQALWQFEARGEEDANAGDGLGPLRHELRRMPARHDMYDRFLKTRFVDKVDPFALAMDVPSRGWRDALKPMMAAFAMDVHPELHAAWRALNSARERAAEGRFNSQTLARMEELFYAMPEHVLLDGRVLQFNEANYAAIKKDWDAARAAGRSDEARIGYLNFFRECYGQVVKLADEGGI